MRIAQIQMPVHGKPADTIAYLEAKMAEACDGTVDLVCLPEMFACPYITEKFPEYAQAEGGSLWSFCSGLAAKYGVYFSAGTMPELAYEKSTAWGMPEKRIYNTAYVFDRQGKQIAKHRKVHLFEISLKNGHSFREADTLSAGDTMTVFDTEFGRIGLCICYDIRFIEMTRLMKMEGADLVLIPAQFNAVTGPAHWELLVRGQAVFNQLFVVGTEAARGGDAGFDGWGHSLCVDPWGNILSQAEAGECVLVTDIDFSAVAEAAERLAVFRQRREDLYLLRKTEREENK